MMDVQGFTLISRSFGHREFIPLRYTCDGINAVPHMLWKNAPEGTKSFALICRDPDAPTAQPFVHWLVANIPADTSELKTDKEFAQGRNDFGKNGYGGPCPPPGTPHRYIFKLYALDSILAVSAGFSYDELMVALSGHVLGEAELVGLYKRSQQR